MREHFQSVHTGKAIILANETIVNLQQLQMELSIITVAEEIMENQYGDLNLKIEG